MSKQRYSCPPHYHHGGSVDSWQSHGFICAWVCFLCGKEIIQIGNSNTPKSFMGPAYVPSRYDNASPEEKQAYQRKCRALAKKLEKMNDDIWHNRE